MKKKKNSIPSPPAIPFPQIACYRIAMFVAQLWLHMQGSGSLRPNMRSLKLILDVIYTYDMWVG